MSTITTWTRLEPVPRLDDLTSSLRAAIADPLWMLARQWQFGELNGEDAGSPIESIFEVEITPVDRFHAGPTNNNPAGQSIDLSLSDVPLEAMVEAQPIAGRDADLRLSIDAGQHFLRCLAASGAENQAASYLTHYPLPTIDETTRPLVMAGVARRVPHGRKLIEDLLAVRGSAAQLTVLPTEPAIPANAQSNVLKAANRFLSWWTDHHLGEGNDTFGASWQPRRLEHAFAVGGTLSDGQVILRAEDYRSGHLDWHDFDIDSRPGLSAPQSLQRDKRRLVRRSLPSRAYYAGMPAERFWEFEDDVVRFGVGSVGRTDIAQMLLSEFALTYGNDWYVVPLTLPTGSICSIRSLKVVDTFGVETKIEEASSKGSSRWDMFHMTPEENAARRVQNLFYLPPALGPGPEGDPIEEVAWFRDEMANLVWAVERQLELTTGGSEPARERYRSQALTKQQSLPVAIDDVELIYRLNTPVPEYWFPMVPVRPEGAPAGVIELELRPMTRTGADGNARVTEPSAPLLTETTPLVLEEEEVPRDGVIATAHWQMTRTTAGHYRLWLAHRVRTGKGEGSSGLVFDVARETL